MTLWIKVTNDEYELPVVVADSLKELASKCGTTKGTISSWMSHYKNGTGIGVKRCPYKKVVIDE